MSVVTAVEFVITCVASSAVTLMTVYATLVPRVAPFQLNVTGPGEDSVCAATAVIRAAGSPCFGSATPTRSVTSPSPLTDVTVAVKESVIRPSPSVREFVVSWASVSMAGTVEPSTADTDEYE